MEERLTSIIKSLSYREKLVLIEMLFDSIDSQTDQFQLADHHKAVLDKRLKTIDDDIEKGESWDGFIQKYLKEV